MTAAEMAATIARQDGKCPICKVELPHKADLDHDHKTGRVRGILCPQCNRGLGMFGDDLERLRSAIEYLESHKPDQDRV